jgi:recombination protein RecT
VYCYYAVYKTKHGGFGFSVMSREDIVRHAEKYSQSYGKSFSPWKTNFDAMAKKTVLKDCLKYAPLSVEFKRGMESDETIKVDLSEHMVDSPGGNIFLEEGEYTEKEEIITVGMDETILDESK